MRKLKTYELNRTDVKTYKQQEKVPVIVILDNVRSMHNVGSVFRTADAFLVEELILCGITPVPPHREINKTALGATESVDWKYDKNINTVIVELKDRGYTIIGIEQTDETVLLDDFQVESGKKYAIVLGNEVEGISDEVIDELNLCLEIPQFGTKHSLNVSVAAGIIIYQLASQLLGKK
ncbi:RNA methyltransferase [Bacteroidota bacterium]